MKINLLVLLLLLVSCAGCTGATESAAVAKPTTADIDPNDVQIGPYQHEELPPDLLKRIRASTEIFEKIDGISYELAVDLYRRDIDPEGNLVLWEEMGSAYQLFCKSRCETLAEQKEVYNLLLVRSMVSAEETLKTVELEVLKTNEAKEVVGLYHLEPKPIEVIRKE